MKSSVKRLAKDQIGLRKSLPPNYFFEDADEGASLPDDLTQLLICLTGPEGTPYSQGVWRVRLDIPISYPQNPPTAVFQTRIFHPNVAEETGAVCLETLKRDWDPKLTLKDILITISCLLIQPNPDSALNQKAGALIQDDYASFARQARLMTKIHAPVSSHLIDAADDARKRGEETDEGSSQNTRESAQEQQQHKPESADKAVLRENSLPQISDTVKTSETKSRKRSLPEIVDCAGDPCDGNNASGGIRKSLRHDSELLDNPNSASSSCDLKCGRPAEKDNSACSLFSSKPQKVIYTARWSSRPGVWTAKARIGIRRL